MRTLNWFIAIGLVCSIGVVPAASAQGKPDKAQLAAAQNHYKRASAFQDLRQYDDAAKEYLKAYDLYPHAEFLFNIAEVYRLGNQHEKALRYYREYLVKDSNGRGAVASRARVLELEKVVAAEKARADRAKADRAKADRAKADRAKVAGSAKPTTAKPDTSKPVVADASTDAGRTSGTTPSITDKAPPRKRAGRTLRIAGLSTAGVGILALGLGVKFGLDASDLASQVEKADPWDQDLYDRGEAKNRNMYIMYGVGSVALIAGGAMYFLGHKAGKESANRGALTVTPVVGGSVTGLVLGGRY